MNECKFNYLRFKKSHLYARLCKSIIRDRDILSLLDSAPNPKLAFYLLFGSVNYLLISGTMHPLVSIYNKYKNKQLDQTNPFPLFRDFCLDYHNELEYLISTKLVQTNEIGRSSYILLALNSLNNIISGKSITFVDVGTSCGLNLIYKSYLHEFGYYNNIGKWTCLHRIGDIDSHIKMQCEIKGNIFPTINSEINIVQSLGIDIAPPNLNLSEDRNWLKALIWPDHPERLNRIRLAINSQIKNKPTIIQANATVSLYDICSTLNDGTILCIFHSHFWDQLNKKEQYIFQSQVDNLAQKRDLVLIALEWINDEVVLNMSLYLNNKPFYKVTLGICDPHGDWIICKNI